MRRLLVLAALVAAMTSVSVSNAHAYVNCHQQHSHHSRFGRMAFMHHESPSTASHYHWRGR